MFMKAKREQQNNKTPRKPPTVRQYQPDELIKFQVCDTLRTLEDIDAACFNEFFFFGTLSINQRVGREFHVHHLIIHLINPSFDNLQTWG